MRHVPNGNPFRAQDPFPGATKIARRALVQINTDSEYVAQVTAACDLLKLKYDSPAWNLDAVAHVGIPSKKVAIYFREFNDTVAIERARKRWVARGWRMLDITTSSLDRISDVELAAHLKAAISGGRK